MRIPKICTGLQGNKMRSLGRLGKLDNAFDPNSLFPFYSPYIVFFFFFFFFIRRIGTSKAFRKERGAVRQSPSERGSVEKGSRMPSTGLLELSPVNPSSEAVRSSWGILAIFTILINLVNINVHYPDKDYQLSEH
jgi:hypothetical protein